MNAKTKNMIRGWVKSERGDLERVAQFIRRLGIGRIRDCRTLVAAAVKAEG